jgi:hypothetical protein
MGNIGSSRLWVKLLQRGYWQEERTKDQWWWILIYLSMIRSSCMLPFFLNKVGYLNSEFAFNPSHSRKQWTNKQNLYKIPRRGDIIFHSDLHIKSGPKLHRPRTTSPTAFQFLLSMHTETYSFLNKTQG